MLNKDEMDFVIELLDRKLRLVGVGNYTAIDKFLEVYLAKAVKISGDESKGIWKP